MSGAPNSSSKDETPKAEAGTWTLISPSGKQWQASNPIRCAAAEQRERVPPEVAMERIIAAIVEGDRDELEADRVRFQSWATSQGLQLRRDDHDDGYFYRGTREAWQAWRAALRIERGDP